MARRIVSLTAVGLLLVALIPPVLAAGPADTVRDQFDAISFDGNNGTISWEDDWLEFPVGDGPAAGQIRVINDSHCVSGNCLRLGDETLLAGIYREVDLSGVTSATLTYSYRREMTGGGSGGRIRVVSAPDIWSPEVIATYNMNADDSGPMAATLDLSAKTGAPLWIGFVGEGQLDGFMYIDNVQVSMSTNRPPSFDTALPDRADDEGDSISFAPDASDPDGDDLSFSATGLPSGVSINSETGLISGTLAYNAGAASPYTTVVTVSDDADGSATESFTWRVADRNRPPSLAPIPDLDTGEGELMKVTANASDPDLPSDSLHFVLTEAPAGATVDSTGRIRWTPGETVGPGTHGFTVKVTDSGSPALSATESFEVAVAEVNAVPSLAFIPDQANGLGDSVSLSVSASDSDVPPNTLTYSATGLPPGVSISAASGLVSGTIPSTATQSNNTVTITVKDNGSPRLQATRSFSWQVTQGNHAPVLAPLPDQEPNSAGAVNFTADATDTDPGDSLNYWLADGIDAVPPGAAIDPTTGQFSWVPADEHYGATYRINVGVSDSGTPRLSDTQLVKITVPKLNESPQITNPGKQRAAEGATINLAITATDPDGDALRYSATGLPDGLAISTLTGVISGDVDFEAGGLSPHSVTVKVTDDGSPQKTDTASFEWTIDETNQPPTATNMSVLVIVGEPRVIELEAEDPDGDELEYSIVTAPVTGILEGEAPELTYTTPGGADEDTFSFSVSDGEFEVIAEVVVEVRAGNTAPTADPDEYEAATDELLQVGAPGVLGNDSDIDAEQLEVSVVSQPGHGTLVLSADGSFTYMPDEGFSGGDKFIYAATDAFGERATATVVINVVAPAVVVPPPIDDGPKIDVVVASTALWSPVTTGEQPLLTEVRRAVVAAAHAGISTLPEMRFPLLLLAIALLLGLTVGRVSTLPIAGGKREQVGWVQSYDELHQVGRLLPEGDEEEVFVHGRAIDQAQHLEAGQQVRFVAADMRGRRIALKVWPVASS